LNEYKNGVFVLGFHVDYWNRLGWKDIYSNAAYSERQQQYGSVFNLNSIYTPQVVVNGKTEFVGSDRNKLHEVVNEELKTNRNASVGVKITASKDKGDLDVSYTVIASPSSSLNFALVQPQATSNVKRGENSGRTLHHVNIVRDFKTITSNARQGSIHFVLPADMVTGNAEIIAFIQDNHSWKITAASEVTVQ
jgi:hypothetical protein